ncbi:universal stress protein [Formosa maritima]|uniref:Universal stress protein n=1 Tax=Formosa maritima TaxID=2592046 RepID=A0A5D0GGN3_9FLAO|nr:universal stress protein [Formosa maritima]TYA58046.1 universal stress protein [Formosa maritima]
MKKILLPTDFSENSWNAIKYALQLFKEDDCTFYLLNTYTPIVYHVEYIMVSPSQFGLADVVRESSEKGLNTLQKQIKKNYINPKHSFKNVSSFNTLILEIKELVEEQEIDYVVMGTKGATGAKEVLFGSNTVQAFKHVKCPVLAIPDNFEFETPHDILFPTDYEINYQDKQIKPIIEIAKQFTSRINVLHVSTGIDLLDEQEQNKAKLEAYFNKIAHLFHDISNQEVTEAITNFQQKARINLLIMINNKHSFFENLFFKSTVSQIGFHLNIPFLVIPSDKKNKIEI